MALFSLLLLAALPFPGASSAAVAGPEESEAARAWAAAKFAGEDPPFSFRYAGHPSSELLRGWSLKRSSRELDERRTEYTLAYADPATGLVARCVGVVYRDFPTVEWTVHFENAGTSRTPILEDIQSLDASFSRGSQGEFLLHHAAGAFANGSDYAPLETPLGPGASRRFGGFTGRPTSKDWAYFNLDWGGSGAILAVGWPGQWQAVFERDRGAGLRARAGQEGTRFFLHPGETARGPLIVLQFWRGDWIGAQNVWRRWMTAHNTPRPGGALPRPMVLASSALQTDVMVAGNEANQRLFIDRYLAGRVPIEYWWMDAGWYVSRGGWQQVGTWRADARRFPRGLREVSDHARLRGVKTLVWFEPERVAAGTELAIRRPEWILGGAQGGLLNLGDRRARRWITDHIDALLTREGVDVYRQDFNIEPLELWRRNDAPDRQGMTENKYVTGYLEFLDELRRRHPDMLIDACASGGRRNDLETLRRAVPLWRSDHPLEDSAAQQAMTYGISLWLPFHGTGAPVFSGVARDGSEAYSFWSNASPGLLLMADVRSRTLDLAPLRRLVSQWRALSRNYFGDYYPLTPYSRGPREWIAWQFDRPERGQGMVQAFRRRGAASSIRLTLRGLEPGARYRWTDAATGRSIELLGRELMERGRLVTAPERPGVAVFSYRKTATQDPPPRKSSRARFSRKSALLASSSGVHASGRTRRRPVLRGT